MEFPKLNIDRRFTTNGQTSQINENNSIKMHVYLQTFMKAFATQFETYATDDLAIAGGLGEGSWYVDAYGNVHVVGGASLDTTKSYVVTLGQTGIAAPTVATTFLNQMGTVTLGRDAIGEYTLVSTSFVNGQVHVSGIVTLTDDNFVPIYNNEGTLLGYYSISLEELTTTKIHLNFYDETFAAVDMVTLLGTSKFVLPEIKVYA